MMIAFKSILRPLLAFAADKIARLPESGIKEEIRNLFYHDVVSERLIEYPLIFQHLGMSGGRVLDVGCRYSNLVLQLAALGYETYGIDLEPYTYQHKNLKFITGDIRKTRFSDNFFDRVVSVSTVEHIGLGFYENRKRRDLGGDRRAIAEMRRILKPGGRLLITVPFGRWTVTPSYRAYDQSHLKKLLQGLKIKKALYFKSGTDGWLPCSLIQASRIDSSAKANSIAFVVAQKYT